MNTLLLSGACGSGKSTLLQLGYRTWHEVFGSTAAFDTDTLLMMVDPRWELTHDERRFDLLYEQCALLAESFHAAAFEWLVIGGNALHTPAEINALIERLLKVGRVFHVTLDPSIDEIKRRVVGRGGDKTPEWLETHVQWMSERYGDWTARIDNSSMTPVQTLHHLFERISAGEGRVTSALPTVAVS